jgi:gliding motility-associated-like protein
MKGRFLTVTYPVIIALVMMTTVSLAQRPLITGLEQVKGSTEKIVTINGSQFGTNPAAITVRFGAAKADIKLIQDQLLQVRVPAGATYDNISITKTTAGLTSYTREHFNLSFQGKPDFDLANLETQLNFPSTPATMDGLYDMCMCDFDGDKKNDVAVSNENSPYIMVYPNNSTGPGNISFGTKYSFNTFARTLHLKCGDLNGDGKPEIVATDGGTGDKVFILKNNSTGPGNFTFLSQSVSVSGSKTKQLEIADLDLDGKPELIVSSQATNTLRILPNQSTLVAVNFNTPVVLTLTGLTNTDGLAIDDLNGDQIPEIITAQYQANSGIYVIRNNSTPGTLSFEMTNATIAINNIIKTLRIADVDRDGKNDITYTQQGATPLFGVIGNTSTSSAFVFATPKTFTTDGMPFGFDFGDLDGDGRADVVIASAGKKSLTILNNTSTPGGINFTTKNKTGLTYPSRHVRVGDLDTDGKPDIAFTSIDDAALVVAASKVSVLRNKTCMVPEILPLGPLNICNTFPQDLEATFGTGATYSWRNITTTAITAGTNVFTPSVSGDYIVTATSEGGTCAEESNIVKVSISSGTAADPLPVYNDPLCVGNTLTLSLNNDLGGGYTYNWTGPEGFTATGPNPTRTNVRLIDAGEYMLDVIAPGGCVARKQSVIVKVIDKPSFTITYPNSEILCSGQFKKLTVNPVSPDYTYQWFEATAGDLGISGSSHDVATGGQYYVKATSLTGCGILESSKASIKVLAVPVPSFTLQETACKGQEVDFVNQSTSDATEEAFYYWVFGDGNTSTERNANHIYNTTGTKTVTLSVAYKNNSCSRTSTPADQIIITEAPNVAITSQTGQSSICPEGTLTLLVSGTFDSYNWSTGATTPTIEISGGGTYSVEVKASNGCELKAVKEILEFPEPVVQVTADPSTVEEGQSSHLFADGLLNYTWEPPGTLNNSSIQDPIATPLATTLYKVVGFDANTCIGRGSIEVKVKGDAIIDKLVPGNFFSPNADSKNPYWMIGDISQYPQCGVTVYDDKGVKVFNAKPYLEDWDGTYNGKPLPDGVYYYIIRCEGEESRPRMGSITILR